MRLVVLRRHVRGLLGLALGLADGVGVAEARRRQGLQNARDVARDARAARVRVELALRRREADAGLALALAGQALARDLGPPTQRGLRGVYRKRGLGDIPVVGRVDHRAQRLERARLLDRHVWLLRMKALEDTSGCRRRCVWPAAK